MSPFLHRRTTLGATLAGAAGLTAGTPAAHGASGHADLSFPATAAPAPSPTPSSPRAWPIRARHWP